MTLYSVVVFIHVIGAIVLVGSTILSPLLGAGLRRATTVDGLRGSARVMKGVNDLAGVAAPLVLVAGLYLAFAGDWWGSGWVEVSLALFAFAAVMAIGVIDPSVKRLVGAADAAPDGPVTAELVALRDARKVAVAESFLLPGDIAIVFLMITKPGFVGSLVTLAVAAATGLTLLRVQHGAGARPTTPGTPGTPDAPGVAPA